ncbi:MAG TPA: acetyl-CoA carboxylase carboxyltransferase subunit alpha [Coriobacteriia bacterium]|nr:acetyl-CoA carboxylase carboxyltransferase subunit alpha [Coriobacteriia bacterium]
MARRRYVMDFERPLVELEEKLAELKRIDLSGNLDLVKEIADLAADLETLRVETYQHLSPWDRVQIARHPERPKTQHYLETIFEDVIEIHGDRAYGDDEAIFAGLATFEGRRVAVLGHRKGTNTKENVRRNFGSPHPEGFRKAMRVMKLADKFGLPIVSFLDTAGAFPGIEAEERGQAWAIAESLQVLADVHIPVVAFGIGEGGSGGALAIGFGDRLVMLENSYYSVISPEACASIIHRDAGKAQSVVSCLKMTAEDLLGMGIVDEVLDEPLGGAHTNPEPVFEAVRDALARALDELAGVDPQALVDARYKKLRGIGEWCTLDEG